MFCIDACRRSGCKVGDANCRNSFITHNCGYFRAKPESHIVTLGCLSNEICPRRKSITAMHNGYQFGRLAQDHCVLKRCIATANHDDMTACDLLPRRLTRFENAISLQLTFTGNAKRAPADARREHDSISRKGAVVSQPDHRCSQVDRLDRSVKESCNLPVFKLLEE